MQREIQTAIDIHLTLQWQPIMRLKIEKKQARLESSKW
jgi:hypothetical protein